MSDRKITVPCDLDGFDDDVISVKDYTNPPETLRKAVEGALVDTIGYMLDGRSVFWQEDSDGNPVFGLSAGFPESFAPDGTPLPPYRTAEKFEGVDGGENGLYGNLPGSWRYEKETSARYVFYQD